MLTRVQQLTHGGSLRRRGGAGVSYIFRFALKKERIGSDRCHKLNETIKKEVGQGKIARGCPFFEGECRQGQAVPPSVIVRFLLGRTGQLS